MQTRLWYMITLMASASQAWQHHILPQKQTTTGHSISRRLLSFHVRRTIQFEDAETKQVISEICKSGNLATWPEVLFAPLRAI